jgi:hypothetical protein
MYLEQPHKQPSSFAVLIILGFQIVLQNIVFSEDSLG